MAGDGGVGDAGGGGAHEDLGVRVLPADGLGEGVFHVVSHLGRGEGQAVVAVDRALDAAGPGEGLLRAEEDRLDLQQVLRDGLGDVVHGVLLSFWGCRVG